MRYTRTQIAELHKKEQLIRMIGLYKVMLNGKPKHWIHQKELEEGIILIEWQSWEDGESDFVYLHPNE